MAPRNEACEDWQVNYAEIRLRSAHLFDCRQWTDCSFKLETGGEAGTTLEAHKLILAMASPVFAAMFYGHIGENESPVKISDIDLNTFSTLLQYVYTDEAAIHSTEAAMNLYKAANKYILVHLEKICLDYLTRVLDPKNVCQIYEFSCFIGDKSLEEKCLEMFSTKTQCVLKSPSFLDAEVNTVKKIVSLEVADINNEMELYDAVLNFADNFKIPDNDIIRLKEDDEQIINESSDNGLSTKKSLDSSIKDARQMLQGILQEIRFLSMAPADLAKVSVSNKLMSAEEIQAIFTNKFLPKSSISMPAGFSTLREPRFRSVGTIRHVRNNLTSMVPNESEYSAPVVVCNVPWRMQIFRSQVSPPKEEPSQDYLAVYLQCTADNVPHGWYCHAKAEVCLLSNANFTPYKRTFSKINKFMINDCWGCKEFIDWNNLINSKKNFIKDGSITLEMHIYTLSPLQSID